ncbi:MAG: hypothetical protein FWH25_04935, partial [Syntrophorhabdaceae bacterium]|nr:hypothetical protein [Syntrophorhabdaceae bacterium]
MNLRIIKKESAKTATVHPFFFVEGHTASLPESYILPEAAMVGGFAAASEMSEDALDAPLAPVIDVEQL